MPVYFKQVTENAERQQKQDILFLNSCNFTWHINANEIYFLLLNSIDFFYSDRTFVNSTNAVRRSESGGNRKSLKFL